MRKLSYNQKEFVRAVQNMIGKENDLKKIESILKSRGYLKVDNGGYKNVFRREGELYCIKVYRSIEGWKHDSYKVPKPIEKYYLHPIFSNKQYMIQRWINRAKKFDKKKAKKLPRSILVNWRFDLHNDNIRYDGHRQRVIDFMHAKKLKNDA